MAELTMNADRQQEDPAGGEAPEGEVAQDGNSLEARINTEGAEDQGGQPEGDLILGKFKSQEDLAKAYKELEQKLGGSGGQQQQQEDSEGSSDTKQTSQDSGPTDLTMQKPEDSSGDDAPKAEQMIAEALRDQKDIPYEDLKGLGISQSQADLMARGIQAEADAFRASIFEVAGGQEEYQKLTKWAVENVDADELEAYNTAVNEGNTGTAKALLRGLRASYKAAQDDGEPLRIKGTGSGTGRLQPFETQADLTDAISDPRYDTDRKYRREVEQRVAISKNI